MSIRRAAALVLLCAAVLAGLILLRGLSPGYDLRGTEGRRRYLSSLGWEIDPASEEHERVLLPEKLEGTMADYNELQLSQGFDLRLHPGEICERYTYRVTNYPDCGQTVLAALFVQGRRVIAGDIHSTALDGFMHGLRVKTD